MTISHRICIFLFFLWIVPARGLAHFDFNANCLKAYQNIFELKLNTARQILAAEKRANPKNSIVPLLENYVDYFYLITTENKAEFDRLKGNKTARMDQISDDKESSSPYYLYAQAEINIQWALLRGRYGEYFNSGLEIRKALNQLNENNKKHPGFHLNLKGLGLLNAVLGSLPDGMLKSTLSTLGIRGNAQTGIAMLDKLAENLPKSSYEPFYEEVIFSYCYVLTDVLQNPAAYSKTMRYTARISDSSLLKTYLQAYVASRNGHTDQAITILNNRPTGAAYLPFPYLDYLAGVCRLNKLDLNAEDWFEKFLKTQKGSNYIKDAYLRLAWIALLKGNREAFNANIAAVRTSGNLYHEKDKQALGEANAPIADLRLLRARLLFDGGYSARAREILDKMSVDDLSSVKDKTEYYYRSGRVLADLDRVDSAIAQYTNCINIGKQLKYYFAANAALQVGKLYEARKNAAKAKTYYNLAISMKDHEFESSIESQARQGLKRL